MKFKIKHGRHLANEGEVYNTTIIEKKLNGYKVEKLNRRKDK